MRKSRFEAISTKHETEHEWDALNPSFIAGRGGAVG